MVGVRRRIEQYTYANSNTDANAHLHQPNL
jgi:hypothetical protein